MAVVSRATGPPLVTSVLLVLLVSGIVVRPAVPVAAWSDVYYPPRFWDANENGVGDDSETIVRPAGPDWTDKKRGSLERAVGQWGSNTRYDPTYDAATGRVDVFVDARDLWCGAMDSGWLAFACLRVTRRAIGTTVWDDIYDAAISVNTSYPYAWGNIGYGGAPDKYSFQGVLTHELGHVAGLGHEDGDCSSSDSRPTMCSGANREQSYQKRTLEPIDVGSVDHWY